MLLLTEKKAFKLFAEFIIIHSLINLVYNVAYAALMACSKYHKNPAACEGLDLQAFSP